MPTVALVGGPCDGRVVEVGRLAHKVVVPWMPQDGSFTFDYEVYLVEDGRWLGPEVRR